MIKGINHSIIEINDTDNEYYERAILVIKPEYASAQRSILENEAKRMLRELDAPSVMKSRTGKLRFIIAMAVSAITGALISALIFFH